MGKKKSQANQIQANTDITSQHPHPLLVGKTWFFSATTTPLLYGLVSSLASGERPAPSRDTALDK